MKTINHKFTSLSAFSAFIANTKPNGYFANKSLGSMDPDSWFAGSESFEAANNLMLQGWQEGANRVKKYMTSNGGAMASRPKIYNSVAGFAPNVPNYLAGNPRNMYNQKRVKVPQKVVTIVYNCAVGGGETAERIEKTASTLFNVVSGLEASGVRVELWIADFSTNKAQICNIAVQIKSAGQPFNLLKMVYPVAHPSFCRRHIFAAQERAGLTGNWSGYGFPIRRPLDVKGCCQALRIPSDNVFGYYDLAGKTESEIAKMIR